MTDHDMNPWDEEGPGTGVYEFVLCGSSDRWFALRDDQFPEAFFPAGRSAEMITAEYNEVLIDGVRVMFSAEPPGWQVSFLNPPSAEWALEVAHAIRRQMERMGGQSGTVSVLCSPE